MKIKKAKALGFCFGVRRAIEVVERGAEEYGPIDSLGSIVHNPEVVKRLHQGHYAIQDYIDLHGHSVSEAHASFQGFMKKAVATGKTGVLIVHGRGLSSPDEPVLKNRVYQWLTSGSWRKWVIAFSSARACDGGAGATYVLLRNTPMTKGRMKNKI